MRPEVDRIFDMIEEYRPTLFFCVPTGYNRLMRQPIEVSKLASLRLCISSGEALPAGIYLNWKSKTGIELIDGVGSTEFGYIFLSNQPGEIVPGSSGSVLPEHKYRFVAAHGGEPKEGEMGELWLSSPAIAAGYWRDPKCTEETFVGGWLHTGDQYKRGAKGTLVYQGRTDDLFKSGEVWVSPVEVESVLLEHAAVAEASVVAERDVQGLEKPAAHIVLKNGFAADAKMVADLRQFASSRLASYKCPRIFHFTPELPKTATGKIQRFKLRSHLTTEENR
jgi:acyl-coenzyme A synthetase/AMP-(fatty) acid ligase